MNNALPMSCLKAVNNLYSDVRQLAYVEPRLFAIGFCDYLVQSLPLKELHDQERLSLMIAKFVDWADVRVFQCRGSPRLKLEPLGRSRTLSGFFWKELNRHGPP